MKLKIKDYQKHEKTVDIPSFDTVVIIILHEMAGDEVLEVVRNDGNIENYDSSDDRFMNLDDSRRTIYMGGKWLHGWGKRIQKEKS